MTINIIDSIKKAEEEAEQIKKKAINESRQIIADAREESRKIYDKLIEEAEAKAKIINIETEKNVRAEIEKRNEQIEEECKNIKAEALKKADSAVDIIIGRIIEINGNS